jgi:hypothetical protein
LRITSARVHVDLLAEITAWAWICGSSARDVVWQKAAIVVIEGPYAENNRGAAASRDARRPGRVLDSTGGGGGVGSRDVSAGGIGHVIGTPSQPSNNNRGARSWLPMRRTGKPSTPPVAR